MRFTTHAVLMASVLALGGCAAGGPDVATLASNSDQIIWEAAQKALAKHQWDNARQLFRRIIDGFPQSEYGPEARLALGGTYFDEGTDSSYILAVSAYRDFLTLFPSHPKSDFAQFRVAEGFFKQRQGPDRDQTQTQQALDEYQRLLEFYPGSPYIEQARERIVTCRQSLARAEFLAGYFYQRTRSACRSAIFRYEGLLRDFPDYAETDEVLFRLAQCLVKTARGLEAPPHLARLIEEYPQSKFAGDAQALLKTIETPTGDPYPPSASPTPAPATPGQS